MSAAHARAELCPDPARPVAVLLVGYPVWWVLGVQTLVWAWVALLAGLWLLRNRGRLEVPAGHWLLLGFLAWLGLSGLMVDGPRQVLSFLLRGSWYAAAVLIGLMGWNLVRGGWLQPQRVLGWLVWLWAASTVLAVIGIARPGLGFVSPFGMLVQAAGFSDPFVMALTSPHLAETDSLYGMPRPSPMFEYTNVWGAVMGVLTPVAVHAFVTAHGRRRAWLGLLHVLALVAIVVSVNRGLWLSLLMMAGYVALRRAGSGDVRALAASLLGVVVVAAVVVLTPLQEVIARRLAVANVSTRENLYSAALRLAAESPVFGHGAPQPSTGVADNNDVSVGTHGQLWTLLVSQGYVGALLFLAGVAAVWWAARPRQGREPSVWLHSVGPIVLLQVAFYDVVPMPMTVLMLLAAAMSARTHSPSPSEARGVRLARTS